ncbi:DUF87 domain-containing protein [archaeon]|nr:DUF87 domain-containing protein [archaeon]
MKRNNFLLSIFLILFYLSFVVASDFGNDLTGDNYIISRDKIERTVEIGGLFTDFVEIENTGKSNLDLTFSVIGPVNEIIEIKNSSLVVNSNSIEKAYFLIKGKEGSYEGFYRIAGSINLEIPINVTVGEKNDNVPFLLEVKPIKNSFDISKDIHFNVNLKKLNHENIEGVSLNYTLYDENNKSYFLANEDKTLESSISFIKDFFPPEGAEVGNFVLKVVASYQGYVIEDKANFVLKKNFFDLVIFGFLPMWLFITILSVFLVMGILIYVIKKRIESKKKYKMRLDLKTIPKKNKDYLFLGKIAETQHETYFDPNKLTTHSIIAGATGGGKSITAQVMIEECLKKDIAVIVFDPTAQWSGMLRKCTDKKMLSFYPKFGLKPKDAMAFKGNVRMVKNARQMIDLNKFISPGQIQIFSLNKLDPKDMDIFVASIIRQIFRSDPKEYPGLKVLLVFDEVHRLLPKFGGNGEGFLQIERACREFRKWGLGVMLVSQVLNDFVGEIKANISTEVQMRTRDEGDLNRIKTKHGEEFLQSLVKASAGVGMFANPAYNHAQPYFINFRPILHNTRRLTDEELEEYNKYNEQVDELEFQIDGLEKEKVDTFDLKMELKLIKDKIMSGSFSVVEIYLEGLKPRVQKEWEKLGKKAPKMEVQLLSEEEIKAGIAEAKAKHDVEAAKQEKEHIEAAKVEVKLDEKIVASLTFDNGVMISSLKELKEYLPSMDNGIFSVHVNEEKNDILKWIKEQFGEGEAKNIAGLKTKEEIVKGLEKIGVKEEAPKKKEASTSKPAEVKR